jgi:hypothetical protein
VRFTEGGHSKRSAKATHLFSVALPPAPLDVGSSASSNAVIFYLLFCLFQFIVRGLRTMRGAEVWDIPRILGPEVEKSIAKIEQSWQVQISALAAFYDFFIFLASPPLQ